MLNTIDHIVRLSNLLYPNGRAFKTVVYGWKETLHRALGLSEARAFDDATSILDSTIPDNDNFGADDATAWERRYGIATNNTDLATRKMAIIQKMNYPGSAKARGNYRFIQKQLRDAGFDVYVYENRFPDGFGGYVTQDPITISGIASIRRHGEIRHGEVSHGPYFENIVANFINEDRDNNFNVGANLRSTFFVGGINLGDYADVPLDRKDEFRHMILRLKPTQTVAFLFINYT